jgi:hypothetical protein
MCAGFYASAFAVSGIVGIAFEAVRQVVSNRNVMSEGHPSLRGQLTIPPRTPLVPILCRALECSLNTAPDFYSRFVIPNAVWEVRNLPSSVEFEKKFRGMIQGRLREPAATQKTRTAQEARL